jgi:hypothetical protein
MRRTKKKKNTEPFDSQKRPAQPAARSGGRQAGSLTVTAERELKGPQRKV